MRIDFQGRGEVKTCSWRRVRAVGDVAQLALRVLRPVCALGQILAQQSVDVLVGAALPGAVGIGKEDLDREPLGQVLGQVLGHLFATTVRQGLPQQRGYMPEFLPKALAGTPYIRPFHPCQEDQARRHCIPATHHPQ